jgi:hypothetical protein
MAPHLCLKCANYKPVAQYYSDPPIDHVISTAWRCELYLYPKDGQDDRGNVVCDYCNSFLNRVEILARKVEGNRE